MWGRYTDPAYGDAVITRDAQGLRMRVGKYEFPSRTINYDVFRFAPPAGDPVRQSVPLARDFQTAVDGTVFIAVGPDGPSVPSIVFRAQAS